MAGGWAVWHHGYFARMTQDIDIALAKDQVDPMLFLFHLWAVTQFYADHATQVAFFRNVAESDEKDRRYLIDEVTEFLLKGAGVS